MKARKPGRPRLDPSAPKEAVMTIRLSKEERLAIEAAAKRAGGQSASEWARRALAIAVLV